MPATILVVVHDLALGGTERIAVRLANAWAARGRRVTLFCGQVTGPLRALVADDVRIVEADPVVVRAPQTRRALGRSLARFLRHDPHDVIFVPGNYHWRVIPYVAGSARVVAQVSAALRKPQRGPLRRRLFDRRMRRLARGAAAVVTLSDQHAAEARAMLPGQRIETIPLPALADDAAPPVPVPLGPPVVVGVGRLVPEKGFDLLVEAFARVADPTTRLTIVGDGPERANLATLTEARGVAERTTLAGYVADAREWLDRARVFVLPSRHEGFPAVIVEALGAGRAVVATDCTPATGIVRAAGGAVVPIEDAAALAAALDAILAAPPPDPDAVAAYVAAFRIGSVADAYLDLFDAVSR